MKVVKLFKTIALANTDWYQAGKFNGYQAIIENDTLVGLQAGLYKLQIGIQIDGTDVNEKQDLNVNNTTLETKMYYPGPYHQNFSEIEIRDYEPNIRVSAINQGNVGYIKIENI